jgi:hypothetical protein
MHYPEHPEGPHGYVAPPPMAGSQAIPAPASGSSSQSSTENESADEKVAVVTPAKKRTKSE